MFLYFVSMIEPKNAVDATKEVEWIKSMQDELNEFECHYMDSCSKTSRKKTSGTRWVFRNMMDEDDIVIRNKASLMAQGFCQME